MHRCLKRLCAGWFAARMVSCQYFLERLSCSHLCQCPNHGFFSLGELND